MKYVVVPNQINDLEIYKNNNIDTFIIGLDGYSINYPSCSIDIIEKLSKEYNLFIAINKNIFNDELDDVLSKLKRLEKINILGILYYDLGLLNLVIENKINTNLVWHQTHMVTNYNTCEFYYNKGVKYGYLANEITLDEIIEINDKTNMKLMVEVFGYPVVSHSRRKLLTNYFNSIGKEKEDRIYNLKENNIKLQLKETDAGATFLNGKITNGTQPLFTLLENKIDYLVLDMQNIDINVCLEVVNKYNYVLNNIDDINNEEKEKIISDINKLVGDNTNFFYKKTIYRVKKGDK